MYVQFEDSKHPKRPEQQVSTYAQILMRTGIAKNQTQANKILIISTLVFLVSAFYILQSSMGSQNPANKLTPQQLEQAGSPGDLTN